VMDRPLTEAEAMIVRYWREIWTEGHVEAANEIYASTYRENLEASSPAEFAAGAAAWLAHFTDFRVEVDELLSIDNRVISRVTYRATHTGDFKRVPARGREVAVSGIDIFEFESGRVVQHWHETDHLELFRQLGAELQSSPA
jgi:steroid delta-isomerase-like uncharacterized protein